MAKKKTLTNENELENKVESAENAENEITEFQNLANELEDTKEKLLRLAAEYDNFRKRTGKEKEQAYGDAKASVIKEFLPVLDNFERAGIDKATDLQSFKKGIEMTYSQFNSILTSLGVEQFGEKGDSFDPLLHNAVLHAERDDLPENTLAEVFSKGYKIGDRILRCADVQVAN